MNKFRYLKIMLIVLSIILVFFGCAKPSESEKYIRVLVNTLDDYPSDVSVIIKLLDVYFDEGLSKRFVDLYEQKEVLLVSNIEYRAYYGASLCMAADSMEQIEDKLLWVKRGMIVLDNLVEDNPEQTIPYIWRALTYSNLPNFFDIRDVVEDDLDKLLKNNKNHIWNLSENQLILIFEAYANIAESYNDPELLTSVLAELMWNITDRDHYIYHRFRSILNKKGN